MVRHLAFFESLEDHQNPEYRTILAGLVVLRLVDDWLMIGPQIVTADVTQIGAVREAIVAVPEAHSARSILMGILDTILQAERVEISAIAPQLLAYGTVLVYASQWKLAIDVFEAVYRWAHRRKDSYAIALDAALQMASAYRNSGNAQEAARGYTVLKELAIKAGDERKRLIAELGFATLDEERGNLPVAETKTHHVLNTAQHLGLDDIYAAALQKLGHIAYKREQYDVAIRHSYAALQLTQDQRNRDRLVNLMAVMFLERGSWQIAQDAFLILIATAQEEYVRQDALLNLLRISASNAWTEEFHRYHRELQAMELPPFFQIKLYRVLAKWHARLAEFEEARKMLRSGIALAEQYQLSHALFVAEKELASLESEASHGPKPAAAVPAEILDAATAITRTRDLTPSKP